MTDLSTTPTAEIAARVIDLHEKATPGPWQLSSTPPETAKSLNVWAGLGYIVARIWRRSGRGRDDAALIAYYRTACVELAKRCLHAEDVAAKSREEALEEAAKGVDEAVAMYRRWAGEARRTALRLEHMHVAGVLSLVAKSVRALGRATEDDGATKAKATQGTKEAG